MSVLPRDPADVVRFTATRAVAPPDLDGRLQARCWQDSRRTDRFVDLVSGGPTALGTRAAILWDDEALYIGFWLQAPAITATLTERDSLVWHDDDVEVFVAGDDAYYELEVNALNTVYEVLFAWDEAALSFDAPGAAPFNGVGFTTHPRGPRTGYWGFDLEGLVTAVQVDGTLADARGWTAEIAIPWRGLRPIAGDRALPPADGDEWRISLSRFNVARHGDDDSGGWALSPHGVWDSHIPELFPIVTFAR